MKLVTLLENTRVSEEYKKAHGLSLYIETPKHKILFDTGGNDYFFHNGKKLGIDLKDVDIAIISHGHSDHGGGLEDFLKINEKAKIYIGSEAFDKHVVKVLGVFKYNIGLKQELSNNSRFIKVDGRLKIDEELILFSDIAGNEFLPKGNKRLLKEYKGGNISQDDFKHEINLLINDKGSYNLLCGCAHRGIVNIVDRGKELIKDNIKNVVGGFHLMGTKVKKTEDQDFLNRLADTLTNKDVKNYYTCHCTGKETYNYLNQRMDNLNEIKTGMTLEL
ncbi:MBL fold metallo-hydrolase [Dethiothermospora halolimnae]|uniref:MBL fold metallo-hydrolase n=1 Tax=Dethiothermospora halolimnae TaxID=3114390 RepID=UPI003CCC21C9